MYSAKNRYGSSHPFFKIYDIKKFETPHSPLTCQGIFAKNYFENFLILLKLFWELDLAF